MSYNPPIHIFESCTFGLGMVSVADNPFKSNQNSNTWYRMWLAVPTEFLLSYRIVTLVSQVAMKMVDKNFA